MNVVHKQKLLDNYLNLFQENTTLLELIYTDICDNKNYLTRGRKKKFITFIDDYYKYTYIYLIKIKDEIF